MAASYEVVVGVNYRPHGKGKEVRAEPGDVVDDVAEKTAKHWVRAGVLKEVKG